MSDVAGGGQAPKRATFQIPEELRRVLAEFTANAAAQLAESGVFAQAASASFQELQPVVERLAEQLRPLQTELLQQRSQAGLQARADGHATSSGAAQADVIGISDSVTVTVTSHDTTSTAPEVVIGEDDGDLGEDLYRLMGRISTQLDQMLEHRPATALEIYTALTNTLMLLTALLALLAPH